MTNSLSRIPADEKRKLAAWQACQEHFLFHPDDGRVDDYGTLIKWADYGSLTEYGWEVDHRQPSALGGADHPANLRALHWRTNRQLGAHLGNALSGVTLDNKMLRPQANALAGFSFGGRR